MALLIASVSLSSALAQSVPVVATAPGARYEGEALAARQAMMARPAEALAHAENAETAALRLSDLADRKTAHITSLWLQSEALSRLNRVEDAAPRVRRALAMVEEHDRGGKLHGDILKASASISSTRGEVSEALRDLHKAHGIYQQNGDARGQAMALQNLGMIYWRARDYGRVLRYYEEANEVYSEDVPLAISNHNNRGNAYKEMGEYEKAEAAYRTALKSAKTLDSPILEARILTNIASAQFLDGDLAGADATANAGLARGDHDSKDWQPFLWGVKAKVAFARGDLNAAKTLIERTFEGVDISATSWIYRDFHDAAQRIHAELGEHRRAFQHLEASSRLEQDVMAAATSTNATLMAAEFDAANQELRITKLEADRFRNDQLLAQSEQQVQTLTVAGVVSGIAFLLVLIIYTYYIRSARRFHADVAAANDRLSYAATHDALTGLANRPNFRAKLAERLQKAEAGGASFALFLVDLDKFKEANDTFGHAAGDELLCGIATRLSAISPDGDHVSRLGGDEFAVIVTDRNDQGTLAACADRIIADLSRPFDLPEGRAAVGATIGIAISGKDGDGVDDLSRSADLALYAAKAAGRGRHKFYDPAMRAVADDRRRLEHDLTAALANGELSLRYQPIVATETGEIEAYEALLRWMHPERGPISPEIFIPIAEDAGLINRIGGWVLRTACETAKEWPEHVMLAVNLSALQVESDGLAITVMSALSSSGLPAHRLELEVTEGVFLRDSTRTKAMLDRLRAMGVSLALDDFGTGYSSLGYLHRAEFSKIKIDRSFVRAAVDGWDEGVSVIQAIVTLANSLGMKTTAEGIETETERAAMAKLGCSQLQGYLFGRPEEHKAKPILLSEIALLPPPRPPRQRRAVRGEDVRS
ncbi:MAG: EAL domain-containing protein [Pacificimonas sp.]